MTATTGVAQQGTLVGATGRELARDRLALGVSGTALAQMMGSHLMSIRLWERGSEPIAPERLKRWRQALVACAQQRLDRLTRQGFNWGDLPRSQRAAMTRYGVAPSHHARSGLGDSHPAA